MPHSSISSASPCHVRIDNLLCDVVVWTSDGGTPVPWIIYGDGLTPFFLLPTHRNPVLRAGTAREAVEGR